MMLMHCIGCPYKFGEIAGLLLLAKFDAEAVEVFAPLLEHVRVEHLRKRCVLVVIITSIPYASRALRDHNAHMLHVLPS